MKQLKQNLKLIIAIICLGGICYPVIYNIMNPETTQMQLLLRFWWLYLVSIFGIAYTVIYNKKPK